MILYHNLSFFDKNGKNLNLKKIQYVNVTVNRNDDTTVDFIDAVIDVITNEYGQIELFHIKNPGSKYNEKTTILISDTETEKKYLIDSSEFIILGPNGEITDIKLPTEVFGFCYPSFEYTGELFFPKISTGLIETSQIYILEQMVDEVSGDDVYSSPRTYKDKRDIITSNLYAKFLTEQDEEISLFDVDYDNDKFPFINNVDVSNIELEDGLNDIIINSKREVILLNSNALLYNVYVKADEEGIYERTLKIYETIENVEYTFATLKFRAEIDGEDERLREMLDNFGIQINEQELKIFRDSDINEELPNYLLLNEKRKEMLLEYHNIFPYIGSYKALVNIINYFGYGDTRLKEYWLNTAMTNKLAYGTNNQLISTNKPISLTSLASFGKAFKPMPLLRDTHLIPEITKEKEVPKFDEDNMDFTDKEGNITDITEIGPSGVTGKRPYVIPENIHPPENRGPLYNPPFDTSKVISALHAKEKPLDKTKVKTIYDQYFRQIEIPMQLAQKGKNWQSEDMLPNKVWRKTDMFGLFYDIVKESGDYDEYGMPITEDAFMFSEDEVLIKLFSLREYLKDKFMPLNARIIDIVGEGIYFDRWAVNIWKDDTLAFEVNQLKDIKFDIDAGENLILDLQDYGHKYPHPNPVTNINTLSNIFVNNFSNGGKFKNQNGPVGCRTKLTAQNFDITWDELDVTWDDLQENTRFVRRAYTDGSINPQITFDTISKNIIVDYVANENEIVPHFTTIVMHSVDSFGHPYTQNLNVESWDPITKIMHISEIDGDFSIDTDGWIEYVYYKNNLNSKTWDTLGQGEFYEIEWVINHKEDGKFEYNVRGNINTFKSIQVDLPYTGDYYITCILYDLTNHSVRRTKTINVKMPNADFMCFGRQINAILTWEDTKNVTWDELQSQWRNIAITNDTTWDDLDGLTWDDLDIERYKDQNNPFVQNNTSPILKISEKDRYVGNIIAVDQSSNTIICNGHFANPKLRNAIAGVVQDYVYFRLDDAVYKHGVISADYSNPTQTIVVVDNMPTGVTPVWELLRELGNHVLIEGDVSYDTNTNEGLQVGQYALFCKDENTTPQNSKVKISDVIQPEINQDFIQGIVLTENIEKRESEYGRIYKFKTIYEVGSPSQTFNFDANNKTVTLNYIPDNNEIIPGFTVLNVKSETYENGILEQRLQVQHMYYSGLDTILEVVELDSDMGMMNNSWNNIITYEYWQFTVKLQHYIDSSENPSDVYLNFNDYPYQDEFTYETTPMWVLNGDWYFDYIIKDGEFSLQVTDIGFDKNGNTIVTLDDPESELYRISPTFEMSWVTFDEDYANQRFGTDIYTWDNMDEVTWDELKHLTWNMFEYQKAPLCGFKITKIAQNGRIQFNEKPFFEFTQIPSLGPGVTEHDQYVAAVDELNNTENEGLTRFNYMLVESTTSPTTYTIHATAKGEGIYYLGYILFDDGVYGEHENPSVSHSYPLGTFTKWNNPYLYGLDNQYANWNPVARAYYEYGINYAETRGWYPADKINTSVIPHERYVWKPQKNAFLYYDPSNLNDPIYSRFPALLNSVEWRYDEAYRLLYDYAITSPFTWDDLIASKKEIHIKKMTTLFFIATNNKIGGQLDYEWTLEKYDGETKCKVVKPFLIWTFSQPGNYNVTLKITDVNGNFTELTKKGVVIVN